VAGIVWFYLECIDCFEIRIGENICGGYSFLCAIGV
jgi:hypothetical protein